MNTHAYPHRIPLLISTLILAFLPASATLQTASAPVTRAQAVTSLMLTRTPDLPPFDRTKVFADLPDTKWYTPYMRAAEQYGIVSADTQGKLHPEAAVTRAEFLKMLTLVFGLPAEQPHGYADVPPNAWYAPYAGVAMSLGLFPDDPFPFQLQPGKLLTQKEASFALEQILKERGQYETREEEERRREQELAAEQARGNLQLYSVISTRRLKVRFVEEPKPAPKPEPPPIPARDHPNQHTIAGLRVELISLINTVRGLNGVRPLKYNVLLERSAQVYAEDMATRGFFSHVSPEGQTLKDRIQKAGYRDRSYSADCFCVKGYSLGENLARGQRTPQEAVDAWMRSPAHRAAILHPEYKDIGLGIAAGYWVQHFGAVIVPGGVMAAGR